MAKNTETSVARIVLPAAQTVREKFNTDAKDMADHLKNVDFYVVVPADIAEGTPAEMAGQALANMLAKTGWTEGSEPTRDQLQAVVDTFTKASRLDQQKNVKSGSLKKVVEPVLNEDGEPVVDAEGKPSTTERLRTAEELQKDADAYLLTPITRGKTEAKKEEVKAKAARAERLDDRAREARERLLALRESDPAQYNVRLEMFRELNPEAAEGLEPVEA